MSIGESVRHFGASIFVERPAQKKSYAQWLDELRSSGAEIERRAGASKNAVKAQQLLRHVAGIERWGQSRLRVFLGAPFVRDEYDGYRPETTLSLDEQRACFHTTRQETLALVQALADAGIPDTATVLHNDFGPLTARGWLRYLEMHARFEMKKLR